MKPGMPVRRSNISDKSNNGQDLTKRLHLFVSESVCQFVSVCGPDN